MKNTYHDDVKSLFINVPVHETIDLYYTDIRKKENT